MLRPELDRVEALHYLTSDESMILEKINTILGSQDEEAKELAIRTMADYPLRILYAFSEKSSHIRQVLETNEYCNARWSERLENMGYPYHVIQSFDKKIQISLFSQIKGAYLMSILDQDPDGLHHPDLFAVLGKACDIGMYLALYRRIQFYKDQLLDVSGDRVKNTEDINDCVARILKDVDKLSNLYWATGCIDATIVLFDLVNYYFELSSFNSSINQFFMFGSGNLFSWVNKYDDHSRPYPIVLLEKATENLYIARLLSMFEQSKKITDELMHGEDLLAGYQESFASHEQLQQLIIEKLHALNVPLVEMFCSKAYDHAVDFIHRQYPNEKLPQIL